jgi:subtilase family serine protease
MKLLSAAILLECLIPCVLLASHPALAEDGTALSPPAITQKIDETKLVTLVNNVRPEANSKNDLGPVDNSLELSHMVLQMQRPAAREAALEAYMDASQTRGSANFHHWLTAEQLGREYGPNPADLAAVTSWLEAHGFQVNRVGKSGMTIDFSGTAAQVLEAFKVEVHNLEVKGERHIGNLKTPQIPAALAPAVLGIASLNDFHPHSQLAPVSRGGAKPANVPGLTTSDGYQAVTPADLATIYNYNPVFKADYIGKAQTIVLLEDSNVYNTEDVAIFRKTFGLDSYKLGSFVQVHPGGCADPGINGDSVESTLDVEYAGASAPGANLELASCADTNTVFGALEALQILLDEPRVPPIVSLSFLGCEAGFGEAYNDYINYLYQQAASEGVSVFVAAGDNGAAGCDDFDTQSAAFYGVSVNGLASTPYNVAVGGTDFSDLYSGTVSEYWNPTNSSTYGSAKSYIPEIPWNDSCAGTLVSNYEGFAIPYGKTGFCNSARGADFLDIIAGSGGPSGCAFGETSPNPGTAGVSGTCGGRPKPSWQKGLFGVPGDGLRDLPDVSLFASNGFWGHYYVICDSQYAPCTGNPENWAGVGGTSASSPVMAGIQALVNQKEGEPQGNPNYVLYSLARTEYGAQGNTTCDATYGASAWTCVFHDITLGDNDVDCQGPNSCYLPSGVYGVLSLSDAYYEKAFNAHIGWDFATGIGSVDVQKLLFNWASAH